MKNPISDESLCLDFTNTAAWHASDRPVEKLHAYNDLLEWARGKDIVTEREANKLRTKAGRDPIEAETTFKQSIEFREALYRVFSRRVHGQATNPSDLGMIHSILTDALAQARLVEKENEFEWDWKIETADLAMVLWPIARSAANLLTSPDLLGLVGQCADDRGCGWFFLDRSKNHSRRWCDINDCGNRARQRRHYQRRQKKVDLS